MVRPEGKLHGMDSRSLKFVRTGVYSPVSASSKQPPPGKDAAFFHDCNEASHAHTRKVVLRILYDAGCHKETGLPPVPLKAVKRMVNCSGKI